MKYLPYLWFAPVMVFAGMFVIGGLRKDAREYGWSAVILAWLIVVFMLVCTIVGFKYLI